MNITHFPKIAFLLLTHNEESHIEKLVNKLLDFKGAKIFCHHDISQSKPHHYLLKHAQMISQPRTTQWGKVSLVYATLDLLSQSYMDNNKFDWFIFLSANCYPIKSTSYILNLLSSSIYDGYIEMNRASKGAGLSGYWWSKVYNQTIFKIPFVSKKCKFYIRHVRLRRRNIPFNEKNPLMYGAQWFMFNRKVVEYILSVSPHNHPIIRFYDELENKEMHPMTSDESFFQCILHNKKNFNLCSDYHRYIDWEDYQDHHPNILNIQHLNKIKESSALFARKFKSPESDILIKAIDKECLT
jgi:hypothetical protein